MSRVGLTISDISQFFLDIPLFFFISNPVIEKVLHRILWRGCEAVGSGRSGSINQYSQPSLTTVIVINPKLHCKSPSAYKPTSNFHVAFVSRKYLSQKDIKIPSIRPLPIFAMLSCQRVAYIFVGFSSIHVHVQTLNYR